MTNTIRKELQPGLSLTYVQTAKFKTSTLSVNLLTPLSREFAAPNAVLPQILLRGSVRYPNMEAITERADELYGAKIYPLIRKKGEVQCIGLASTFVDEMYLPKTGGETAILEPIAELLGEILLNPATSNGKFRAEYVAGERDNLLEEIRGRINNKTTYALARLVEQMCADEPFATFRLGTEDTAETMTADTLTERYHDLLETAQIEIFYCGSVSIERVEAAVQTALIKLPRGTVNTNLQSDVRLQRQGDAPREFREQLDVTQGKLTLGFRLGNCMQNPSFGSIMLFNYLYGGSVNSKLFLNVREKLSLCYYAQSVLEKYKGLLFVASGVEFDKYDEARREILAQLAGIAAGDITDEELSWAKRALVTDLRLCADEQDQLEDFCLQQTILGLDYSLEHLIESVERTSSTQLGELAAGIELDAVYFLSGISETAEVTA